MTTSRARRRLLSIVAGTALTALSLTGCAGSPAAAPAAGPGSVAPQPAPGSPQAIMAPAVAALREGNFAFAVDHADYRAKGVVHRPSGTATYAKTGTRPIATLHQGLVMIGEDLYVKLAIGTDDNQWRHYGAGTPGRPPVAADDVTGVASLLGCVADARADGATVTGTLDVTALRDFQIFNPEQIVEFGKKPIPFTAALGAQGRLGKLTIEQPPWRGAPSSRVTFTFTGYGAQTAQARPAGTIVEG